MEESPGDANTVGIRAFRGSGGVRRAPVTMVAAPARVEYSPPDSGLKMCHRGHEQGFPTNLVGDYAATCSKPRSSTQHGTFKTVPGTSSHPQSGATEATTNQPTIPPGLPEPGRLRSAYYAQNLPHPPALALFPVPDTASALGLRRPLAVAMHNTPTLKDRNARR